MNRVGSRPDSYLDSSSQETKKPLDNVVQTVASAAFTYRNRNNGSQQKTQFQASVFNGRFSSRSDLDADNCGCLLEVALAHQNQERVVYILDHYKDHLSEENIAFAVSKASRNGWLEILNTLLSIAEISNETRGRAIIWAVIGGHLEILQKLVEKPELIPEKNHGVAVIRAAERGHGEILEILFALPIPLSGDVLGDALINAIYFGQLEIIEKFLRMWDRIPHDKQNLAVLRAAERPDLTIFRALWNAYPFSAEFLGDVFVRAVLHDKIMIVRELFSKKDQIPKESWVRAISIAVERGYTQIFQVLFDAWPLAEDPLVKIFIEAVERKSLELLKKFLSNRDRIPPDSLLLAIGRAAEIGDLPILEALLEIELIAKSDLGWPLVFAAQKGHISIVKKLLEYKNGICQERSDSAVVGAIESGQIQVAIILLCNVKLSTEARADALVSAAKMGFAEIVRALLEQSPIDSERLDEARADALVIAVKMGYTEIVRVLLTHSPIESERMKKAYASALVSAVENGPLKTVCVLLEHGPIELEWMKKARADALVSAAKIGFAEIVRALLEQSPIESEMLNEARAVALVSAVESGLQEVVRVLLAHKPIESERMNEACSDALVIAVTMGFPEIVRVLLAHSPIESERMKNARADALVSAAEINYLEMVRALLEHNSSIELERLKDAVRKAIDLGHLQICIALFKNPLCLNECLFPALQLAVIRERSEIFIYLSNSFSERILQKDRVAVIEEAIERGLYDFLNLHNGFFWLEDFIIAAQKSYRNGIDDRLRTIHFPRWKSYARRGRVDTEKS